MSEFNLSGLDILIVEDDPMLRKREAALLEKLGADVTTAETIAAARQLIAAMSFDFAVLDVNLPDGLGTDLLKEKLLGPETAVIVVTAHGAVTGTVEAMRLGATDYLVKPFETEELPLVLERARRSRQSARVEEDRRSDRAREGFFFGNALKSGMNVFVFTGATDQQFRLQSSANLATWTDGALLEFLDSTGTLIYVEDSGTNAPQNQFYRALRVW